MKCYGKSIPEGSPGAWEEPDTVEELYKFRWLEQNK